MIPSLSPSANLFLAGLTRLQATITAVTNQLSSGYRITQPSDAPDQISPLLQFQANLAHNEAVGSNLTAVQAYVSSADQALSTAIQLLNQAQSIAAQGATGTTTAASRSNLAQQIDSIEEQIAGIANTNIAGRYIFSGDQDNLPSYAIEDNPPVRVGLTGPAKVIAPADTVVFTIQTASPGGPAVIVLTGQTDDTVHGQIDQLNTSMKANNLKIAASLDGSGNLQFRSTEAFSVTAQAFGAPSLVNDSAPETANNTGLHSYRYTPQTPAPGGGDGLGNNDVQIAVGSTTATLKVSVPPQAADIAAMNAALVAQNISTVSAVLDETDGEASISFQGSVPFSISDDHNATGKYGLLGNSVAPLPVNRLITPTGNRQTELSDRSFTVVSQTAQELFDARNPDDSPTGRNVFFALNSLKVALSDTSSPNQQARITAAQAMVENASAYLNAKQTFYGNTQNRISAAIHQINLENANLQQEISDIRDTDVVQSALDQTTAITQEQAALAAQARMPHSSLFDFLG